MAKRPKTVGLTRDVFVAGRDMAQVPVPSPYPRPPRKVYQRSGFLRASGRKVPTVKCRISKRGREGSFDGGTGSFTKQKVPWTSGRGVSFGGEGLLRFVCSCRLGKWDLLPGKFPSRRVFRRCICWGFFRLEQNQKTAKRLFGIPFSAGVWVVEATSE